MKCPKCSYVSHDYLDACRNSKCGIDLVDFKAQMQLHVIQAGHIDLVAALGGAEGFGATGTGNESFFNSQMLMESEENGDFDISLDDDLSLATMSIAVEESAEFSGIFNRPGFKFETDDAAATTISDRSGSGAPLGPPTSGYATVMLDLGDMADPNDLPGAEADAAVDTPTGNDISLSHDDDDDDLDADLAPPTGVESAVAFAAEDPLPEVASTEAELPERDIIPSHRDAATMPSESGEIDLSSEFFSLSSEVAETHRASESLDDPDLQETDRPAVPLSAPVEEDIHASTETAFADFLPLPPEELDLPDLQAQEEAFDNDPDATMVDDAGAPTLADEVFDFSLPPTQDITHVDTQEVTQDQVPQDDDFALPPLPMQDCTDPNPQEATVADEAQSQTLLDGMFTRPADLTQEQTLIETQEGAQIADGLMLGPIGGNPATGTPHPNPEEDEDFLEDDAELEFGDETPPAS